MLGIEYKTTFDLDNNIIPQSFLVCDENNYLFDKINMDEGRLYKFSKDWTNMELVVEVDDGQCFFGRDGNIYILYHQGHSIIEVYDKSGSKIKELNIDCIIYWLDIDENGIIFAIIVQDDSMWLRMYDNNGVYIRTMHSRNMPLISTVYHKDGDIYIGGVSESNPARIEKINYLSYIDNSYNLDCIAQKPVIVKILKYNDSLIAALSDDSGDYLCIVDQKTGQTSRYDISKSGIENVMDMQLVGDNVILLGKEKKVALYNIIICDTCLEKSTPRTKKRKRAKVNYGYILYLICLKNLHIDLLKILMRTAAPLAVLFMICSHYLVQDSRMSNGLGQRVSSYFFLLLLITALGILIKSVTVIWRRRYRIDNMLDFYNKINIVNRLVFRNCIIAGIIMSLTVFTLLYANKPADIVSFLISVLFGVNSFAVIYGFYLKYMKVLKNDMKNTVFELLSFNAEEYELLNKIGNEIKKLRKSGIEQYRIIFTTKGNGDKSVIKLIKKWCSLRRKIVGCTGKLQSDGHYLVFDLNLKNRDIKYSRLAVIEDFICYIYGKINISSVMIKVPEDDVIYHAENR